MASLKLELADDAMCLPWLCHGTAFLFCQNEWMYAGIRKSVNGKLLYSRVKSWMGAKAFQTLACNIFQKLSFSNSKTF